MPRIDIAPLLEQIHTLDDEDDVWFGRIAALLLRRLQGPVGVDAFRYEPAQKGKGSGYRSTRIRTGSDGDVSLARYDEHLPSELGETIYSAGTKVALNASFLVGPDGRTLEIFHEDVRRLRVNNAFGMACDAGEGRGVALSVPLNTPSGEAALPQLGQVARHVASALRLRRHVARSPSPRRAWLDPSGDLLDAEGLRPTAALRARLRALVRSREAAREACHREGEAALAMWSHLLDGEWSFLDFEELGGRRRVIAFRNPEATRGLRALTAAERIVVERAARGRPNKEIAIDLGASEPTVANHLARAMAKLGVPNRMILIQTFAALIEAK